MGKRSKFRKKLSYSRNQFIKQICVRECKICVPGNPEFCFTMYEADPKRFMKFGLDSVIKGGAFAESLFKFNKELKDCSDDEVEYFFHEFFCKTRVCGNISAKNCKELTGCLTTFRKQLVGDKANPFVQIAHQKKKHRKKHKGNYKNFDGGPDVPNADAARNPTPEFFCNEGFMEEIKQILHGDNPGKQDQAEESSDILEKCFGGGASDSQS